MALEQQHPISVDEIDTENERNRMELDENIKVGMKVNSEEEAFDLYNRHALRKGFTIRRGNKRKINGVVRQREFLCSKQGRREDTCDVKKINRLETRTECKARIRFTISKDNIWEVSSFNDEHNHDFADEDEKHNLRSGRKILDAQAAVLCSMVGSGIKPVKSYHFLAKEVCGCLDENEFQSTWNDMIHKYKLEDNGWLKRLYECRDKWCTTLSKDIFSAEMKSTQRSESMNNVFHQVLGTSLTVTQVVEYYEEKVEYIRQKERDDDFNCKNGSLGEFISHGGLLGHAASIYTLSAFPMFKKQYLIMRGLSCNLTKKEGVVHVYEVQKPQGRRVKLVKFDQSNSTVVCSCKLFETLGILCRHALRVLFINNVNEIPAQYIMRRWTKEAKKGAQNFPTTSSSMGGKPSRLLRFSELNHLCLNISDKASLLVETTKVAKMKLMELLELIEKDVGSQNLVEEMSQIVDVDAVELLPEENQNQNMVVLDPPYVRPKGVTNARIKSQLEKKNKKKTSQKKTLLDPLIQQDNQHGPDPLVQQDKQNGVSMHACSFLEGDNYHFESTYPYPSFTQLLNGVSFSTAFDQDLSKT